MQQIFTMTDKRNNSGYECDPLVRTAGVKNDTAEQMIARWVATELAWSCNFTKIEETCVETKTRVMGCIDTTILEGQGDAIGLVYKIALMHGALAELRAKMNQDSGRDADSNILPNELDRVMEMTKGIPLHLEMGAGMILGGPRAKATMIAMLQPTDKETIDKLHPKSLDELVYLVCMKYLDRADQTEFY